jgi:hypothetical protein
MNGSRLVRAMTSRSVSFVPLTNAVNVHDLMTVTRGSVSMHAWQGTVDSIAFI